MPQEFNYLLSSSTVRRDQVPGSSLCSAEELKSIRHTHWSRNKRSAGSHLHHNQTGGLAKQKGQPFRGAYACIHPKNLCRPLAKASVRDGSQDRTQTSSFLLSKDYLACTRHMQWCQWMELACPATGGSDKRQGQRYQEQCLPELNPW